ncbi:N2227-like protein-domain-containing protein [Lipomyces doorenjongii]|uniref:N2227-like protein-domain-containing protein n=1 Tax=Lipomyces doorenjongii TaxID=383834 RepID=UPI0034CEC990
MSVRCALYQGTTAMELCASMAAHDAPVERHVHHTEAEEILEQRALTSTLNSLLVYGKAAHYNLTKPRLAALSRLSERHRELLAPFYTEHLAAIDHAIDINAEFLKLVVQYGANEFEAPQDLREWEGATSLQLDQTRSSIKQVYRDWSAEGAAEREGCYGRVIRELNNLYSPERRSDVRVLVPGAGLGRLAYDIACEGYVSQGNEFSYHMLVLSNFLLNHTTSESQFTIYPFLHSFSHTSTATNQLRAIRIPDKCPATFYTSTASNFSFTAGSFAEIYANIPDEADKWDVITTVFFLDTAHNVLEYIDVISQALKNSDGTGYWINFGPLLYHFEEEQNFSSAVARAPNDVDQQDGISIELPLDYLISIVEKCGFVFEKLETGIKTTYAADERAMGNWVFDSVFWVARKMPTVHPH